MNEINEKSEIIKTFHENGQIKEEIETLNNKWHGLYKLYHENGQLLVVTRFENEKQVDGIVDSYDDNGTLIRTVIIKNGNFNGPFKEFYPSGTIKKEGVYKEGEIIGIPIEYFEDGNVIRSKRNDSNINFASGKTKDNPESNEVESTNNYINTVLTNKEFKDIIDSYIKNEKVKNFELNISISKWYGYTPFKCSGEFEGHNFISKIVEVCKWGICEHNYKDINKLLNDIKDYEIDELHKHLDIEIISEDEDFEIDFIKWEKGTPDEFIEEIEEDWGAFDIRDNSTEEEQLDFIFKEGSVIDEIQILLSNDDSTFKLSWINSKENEENDKVISTLKHVNEYNNNLLVEAITKTGNAFNDNDKSYDFYENGQYQEGINSVKKALEIIPNNSTFLDTLALGYYYLGDYNSAIEISNNCIDFDIEKDSENAEHYFNRGNIQLKMNEIVKAKHDFEKALEIDNSFDPAIEAINKLIEDEEENKFDLIINQINTELYELSDKNIDNDSDIDENIEEADLEIYLMYEGALFTYINDNEEEMTFEAFGLIVECPDDEDYEWEVKDALGELVFTTKRDSYETYLITDLPENIVDYEFTNSVGNLHDEALNSIEEAVEFIKNLKTISFKELNPKEGESIYYID